MPRILNLLILFSMLVSMYSFANFSINIVDQYGKQISNAVIEVETFNNNELIVESTDTYVMDQINKSFKPDVLVIPKGSKVRFPNSDDIRHHVYSFSKTKSFELKLYAGKTEDPIQFLNQGVVVLGCNIHDSMVGYIYVQNNNAYQTDKNGKAHLKEDLKNIKNIWIWHPRAKKGVDFREKITLDEMTIVNNETMTFSLNILPPEPRDSFEDVFKTVQ